MIVNYILLKHTLQQDIDAESLLYRIQLYQNEEELQKELIGKRIDLSKLSLINGERCRLNQFKIIIVKNFQANNSCYIEAINYYNMISKNKLTIITVLSTKSWGYARATAMLLPSKVLTYIDTSLSFMPKLMLKSNDAAVILLDNENICIYCYLLEIDNIIRNHDKFRIIESYIYLFKDSIL